MFVNYTICLIFAANWDACMNLPSDCVWMIPGTFDCDGNTLPGCEA